MLNALTTHLQQMRSTCKLALLLLLSTLLLACDQSSDKAAPVPPANTATESTDKPTESNPPPLNTPPVVNAGTDLVITGVDTTVRLTGSADDSDGTVTLYQWQQLTGIAVSLARSDTASTEFTAPAVTEESQLTFRLTATDNQGASSSDDITVTLSPPPPVEAVTNTAPTAGNGHYTVEANHPLQVTAPGLLANATDAQSDPLTASLVTPPSSGTLSLSSDGSFSYTPNAHFSGVDSFVYRASDGQLNSPDATIQITVSPPVVTSEPPVIAPIADARILQGNTYTVTPVLSKGSNVRWSKEYGQDDMNVDPVTGKVTWRLPSTLPSESFHLGIKARNAAGSTTETWILTVGTGNIIHVGPSETYTTLKAGMAAMSAGDTLIIRDGTYPNTASNQDNAIAGSAFKGQQPPSGSASHFTTVMAENPGKVTLDGQGVASTPIYLLGTYDPPEHSYDSKATVPREYIAIKGVTVRNAIVTGIMLSYTRYIKLIDVGVVDSAAAAAQPSSSAPNVYVHRSDAILVEGLYSWGHSRYKMQFKDTTRGVVRRSIIRLDGYRGKEPVGGFQSYCSKNIVYQNNIAIDGDQSDFWTHFSNHQGLFGVPATGCTAYPEGNVFVRNIGLNSHTGLMQTDAADNPNPTLWQDMVGWDLKMDRYTAGTGGHSSMLRGTGASVSEQITMGRARAEPGYAPFAGGGRGFFYSRSDNSFVNNSIIYQFGWNGSTVVNQGPLMWASSNRFDFDYNNIYDFAGTYIGGSVGTITNTVTTDPLKNGLRYLPRIESGSTLNSAGKNGTRIGANVTTFIGKSGTFYGEPGYNQETQLPMWPFPHEDLYKTEFQNYRYTDFTRSSPTVRQTLTGNRGFARAGVKQLNGVDDTTLTSYIWEYLGNPIPDNIYNP